MDLLQPRKIAKVDRTRLVEVEDLQIRKFKASGIGQLPDHKQSQVLDTRFCLLIRALVDDQIGVDEELGQFGTMESARHITRLRIEGSQIWQVQIMFESLIPETRATALTVKSTELQMLQLQEGDLNLLNELMRRII